MSVYGFSATTARTVYRAKRQSGRSGFEAQLRATTARLASLCDRPSEEVAPRQRARELAAAVDAAMEASARAARDGDAALALEKASEAVRALQSHEHFLAANALEELRVAALAPTVGLCLARAYEGKGLVVEALAEYRRLAQNEVSDTALLARVNMANLLAKDGQYAQAIKAYKMAIDSAHSRHSVLKLRIARNIAHTHVRSGEVSVAAEIYGEVLAALPDADTACNFALCAYALRDGGELRRAFSALFALSAEELPARARRRVLAVARATAASLGESALDGYDWLVEAARNSPSAELFNEIEVARAVARVEGGNGKAVIAKAFAGRTAATLSALHAFEGNVTAATESADRALSADRGDVCALVNRGNCFFRAEAFDRAKEFYNAAIAVQSDCVEALYNLAIVNRRIGAYGEALTALNALNAITDANPSVFVQFALTSEADGDRETALKWLNLLAVQTPDDARVQSRLARLYSLEGDEAQALHHAQLAFQLLPAAVDNTVWLGAHYAKIGDVARAREFYEQAALAQPSEPRWRLMIASCNRRLGLTERALEQYKAIEEEQSECVEALECIVELSAKLGREAPLQARRLATLRRAKVGRPSNLNH